MLSFAKTSISTLRFTGMCDEIVDQDIWGLGEHGRGREGQHGKGQGQRQHNFAKSDACLCSLGFSDSGQCYHDKERT